VERPHCEGGHKRSTLIDFLCVAHFLTSDQVDRMRSSSSAVTGLAAVQAARRYQSVPLPHRRQARKQATHPEGRELPGE
jgi:hypothetical protein